MNAGRESRPDESGISALTRAPGRAQESLNAIFEHAPIVMILVDKDGRVEKINHAGTVATGKERKDLLGRLGGEAFNCVIALRGRGCGKNEECKSCKVRNTFSETFRTGKDFDKVEGEMFIQRNSALLKRDVLISTTAFETDDGKKVLVSLDDITDRKDLERLRDNLTHMIVHDMRSPLMGMSGYLELALRNAQMDERTLKYLANAQESTKALAEMVSSLLDVSRLEAGEMPLSKGECDLREIVRTAIESLGALTKDRNVSLEAPDGPVTAFCDPDIVRRVVVNLLGNAIKFTPKNGSVHIKITRQEDGSKVAVTDTGPGIAPEYHGRIFEKFGQVEARKQGQSASTGLGLTFCKLAVEAHGGKIGVDSAPGKGSTFWFVLPARDSR